MKCPTCGENTPDAWELLLSQANPMLPDAAQELSDPAPEIRGTSPHPHRIHFDRMNCAADGCQQLVVRGHASYTEYLEGYPEGRTRTWFVYPRHGSRPVDPLVSEAAPDRAADFLEAGAILDLSPRMSAVLSRRILADLLERYVNLDAYGVSDRIDSFRADAKHPSALREHMHHFREIADFGAHTQRNDQDQIIEVDQAGAAWMLDYLERLFDYLIVSPAKDREITRQWDKNLQDANRRPIKPLPSEADGEERTDREDPEGTDSPGAEAQ